MMRTFVKTTPFVEANLSSTMGSASLFACWIKHSDCSSLRVRPDVFRGETRTFLWLLDRRPMATSRQRLKLSALDPLCKPLRRAGRGDGVLLAGHEEGWAAYEPKIGALRRSQSLARFCEAL